MSAINTHRTSNYSSLCGPRPIPRLRITPQHIRPPTPPPPPVAFTAFTPHITPPRTTTRVSPWTTWSTSSESDCAEEAEEEEAEEDVEHASTEAAQSWQFAKVKPRPSQTATESLNSALEGKGVKVQNGPVLRPQSPEVSQCAICFTETEEIIAACVAAHRGGYSGRKLLWNCDQKNCSAVFCLVCIIKWNHIAAKNQHQNSRWHCPTCTRSQDYYRLRMRAIKYAPEAARQYFHSDMEEVQLLGNDIQTVIDGYWEYYTRHVSTTQDILSDPRAMELWDDWYKMNAFRYDTPSRIMNPYQALVRIAGYIPFIEFSVRYRSLHARQHIRTIARDGFFGPNLTEMIIGDVSRVMAIRLFQTYSIPQLRNTIDSITHVDEGHLVFLPRPPLYWIGILHPQGYRHHRLRHIPITAPRS